MGTPEATPLPSERDPFVLTPQEEVSILLRGLDVDSVHYVADILETVSELGGLAVDRTPK